MLRLAPAEIARGTTGDMMTTSPQIPQAFRCRNQRKTFPFPALKTCVIWGRLSSDDIH